MNLTKHYFFFSKLKPRGQPASLVFRVNQLEAEFREKIEDIKVQTSRRSEDQDETIAIIKVKQRNSAQLLNQNKEDMQVLKLQNKEQAKRIDLLELHLNHVIIKLYNCINL